MAKARWAMLVAMSALAGCAWAPPQPWEKDLLAKPSMTMEPGLGAARFGDHVYESRENSSGGQGVQGGGCGCN